ncbi:MAG: hypothetical protein CMJ74_05535 [Planctomycetaceae bacterium]|nr:hypothetical protein [Planctomycetaceae bacterium]|tara:strand:- start:244 stop:573 length:330 start_codon:yes stop_codon:yes gene_type:complete
MKTKNKNPFYVLLILVGILFFVTATTYGVMAIRETNRPDFVRGSAIAEQPSVQQEGLLAFMEQHGDRLLIVEALLLGFLTVAAIGTDELVGRGAKKAATSKHSQKGTEK